jgi:hypothetical protein
MLAPVPGKNLNFQRHIDRVIIIDGNVEHHCSSFLFIIF